MTFAQRRNRLSTRFSERVPVVKRRVTVLYLVSFILNTETVHSSETSGTDRLTTQRHIPQEFDIKHDSYFDRYRYRSVVRCDTGCLINSIVLTNENLLAGRPPTCSTHVQGDDGCPGQLYVQLCVLAWCLPEGDHL
jgi:hypothetical protein